MQPFNCPACSAAIEAESRYCPACGAAIQEATSAPTATFHAAAGAPSPPPSHASDSGGRFLPGQVLIERYRVIGLLGRGGMGEVYRADDLKLGQPVALKFLPEAFGRDPERLQRFFNEVRTARQVSHPNVCRVHDLGEVDGHHFLSMEYVDGEDLGTLLRRIGRVPREKAIQIARQLCAGLAAAHNEGFLHRDLKPANIMLDGRGRVRITDFGLAGIAASIEGAEILAGTPAYQAPEQLAGREVSEASDIYALGLVLYELFTGHRAFQASTREELIAAQEASKPTSLASHVEGLDDSIERIILRCLDPKPEGRPVSAIAVSSALPGGDPLAAALAAGETPSPEMVANAQIDGALPIPIAALLLLIILLGIGVEFGYRSVRGTLARVGLPKTPAELSVLARQVLEEVGHEAPVVDQVWDLSYSGYEEWIDKNDPSAERWDNLEEIRPHPVLFWYRQSPTHLLVEGFDDRVRSGDPPLDEPGMARVYLDAEGRLLELIVIPEKIAVAATGEIDWEPLWRRAQIALETLRPVESRARPALACDQRVAWRGSYGGAEDVELHIEGCSGAGKILYFGVFTPWESSYEDLVAATLEPKEEAAGADQGIAPIVLGTMQVVMALLLFGGGFLLARRNLRLGRADRIGAMRLAVAVLLLTLSSSLLLLNHGPSLDEMGLVLSRLSNALFFAVFAWIFYTAAEPIVRKLWPDSIIAWRRLLDGRFRDPLIGRDLLIGGAFCQLTILIRLSNHWFPHDSPWSVGSGPLVAMSGVARTLGWHIGVVQSCVFSAIGIMTIVVVARVLLRRNWLTWLVLTTLIVTLVSLSQIDDGLGFRGVVGVAVIQGGLFFVIIRYGLLALVAWRFFSDISDVIRALDPSTWYFGYSLASLSLFVAVAVFAFVVSLGGRRLLDSNFLEV